MDCGNEPCVAPLARLPDSVLGAAIVLAPIRVGVKPVARDFLGFAIGVCQLTGMVIEAGLADSVFTAPA